LTQVFKKFPGISRESKIRVVFISVIIIVELPELSDFLLDVKVRVGVKEFLLNFKLIVSFVPLGSPFS
jgi:hypothetical protein